MRASASAPGSTASPRKALALADQHQRQMRERREIARGADRALGRDGRQRVGGQQGEQRLHHLAAGRRRRRAPATAPSAPAPAAPPAAAAGGPVPAAWLRSRLSCSCASWAGRCAWRRASRSRCSRHRSAPRRASRAASASAPRCTGARQPGRGSSASGAPAMTARSSWSVAAPGVIIVAISIRSRPSAISLPRKRWRAQRGGASSARPYPGTPHAIQPPCCSADADHYDSAAVPRPPACGGRERHWSGKGRRSHGPGVTPSIGRSSPCSRAQSMAMS